ncbi:RNA ligase partner protein [Candidatus Microgenomates bacterium]|nr:RNA ligase partner protein [Candidatus Microgenomates bacterium]
MDHFILDTNLFFNMEAGISLGGTTKEVMQKVIDFAVRSKADNSAVLYMPPRIVDEISGFFDNPQEDILKELLSVVIIKAPDASQVQFPAPVFYRLIEDVRNRSYRGLQIAEEEVEKTATEMMGKEVLPKVPFQKAIGAIIKTLRMRYRNATRTGFLDSVADLDLIMLAKEVNGCVVTTDEGVTIWARHFGVKEMPATAFGKRLSA